jgi:excisionase family DNA binding protein
VTLRDELHALVDRIADEIERTRRADEWIDQAHSPLGRAKHLRLAREGVLPSSKEGRQILIKRSVLDAYIAKHKVDTVRSDVEDEEREAERIAAGIGRR